tara:strand:+ start:51003 stop:51479 length:477 start_codon:yes stop_codon:yes gene_type:complete
MMGKQPMTQLGKEQLTTELKHLKSIERPAVIKAIEEARGHGDLSENADYDAAKEKQGFIESRISEIEGKLAEAEVVDPAKLSSETIIFGATVTLLDCDSDEEVFYQIVGEDEADVKKSKISVFSPLARALIGKKSDDVIELKTPKGEKEYEVLKIEFK